MRKKNNDQSCGSEPPTNVLDACEVLEEVLDGLRCINIIGPIDDIISSYVCSSLQAFASSKDPVYIYISSDGGEVIPGYAIVDQMELSPFPIYTIIRGRAASMAAIIATYGTKGCRYMTKNSCAMIHEIRVCNAEEPMQEHLASIEHVLNDQARKMKDWAKRMNISVKELTSLTESTYWMNLREAMEVGLIDGLWDKEMEASIHPKPEKDVQDNKKQKMQVQVRIEKKKKKKNN
jgi:ATP-dependent Clp protease protease subunit